MATYSTNELRNGMKVMIDGDPCNILENEYVKPGKGQAFNRIRFKNLITGRTLERTIKSGDTMPSADIMDVEAQYLYNDGSFWHFMSPESYEQFAANESAVGEAKSWLKEQETCMVTMYNGAPLSVSVPNTVTLKVVETEPGIRGDTVTGGSKSATLETGAVVRVPLFVNIGDSIKVDTRTGEYLSRTK